MTPISTIQDDGPAVRARNSSGTMANDRVADAHTLRETGTCASVSGDGKRVAIVWDRSADGHAASYAADTVVTTHREGS